MPVVVNEMEIVVAEPAAGQQGQQPAPAGAHPSPPELAELLERRARQALRLFAH